LRLHYDPIEESKKSTFSNDPDKRKSYKNLRLTGVGGLSGTIPIWKESLLSKMKNKNNGVKIKMAIGITMYNEDWKSFLLTITGVCQGLIDIYNDEKKMHSEADKDMITWNMFKDQFVIILIADGFKELTDDKSNKNAQAFPENAKRWGIFD
jgi:hypothetical protein